MPVSGLPPYDDTNIFARILRGEIPSKTVFENEWALAFHDINPQAPLHVLVVPRDHVASLNQAHDPAIIGHLQLAAAEIAKREGVAESGYRTVINTNKAAGQTVFHIHVHVLGGRDFGWPPG